MGSKTCGTCRCGQDLTVWCSCSYQRKPATLLACDDYRERTDSVEQGRAASVEEIAKRAVWMLAHHPDSSHKFAGAEMEAELRALGVIE